MEYRGILYRAISPRYARTPLSGDGAALYGGRFNRMGMSALYTSMDLMTCLYEANQTGGFYPATLVAYDAHFTNLIHFSDLSPAHTATLTSSDDWRTEMNRLGSAPSQDMAFALSESGFDGMIVPSFEPRAAKTNGRNLVLWRWGADLPAQIKVIDPENRLVF